MAIFRASAIIRSISIALLGAGIAVGAATAARANVITDWDAKAVAFAAPGAQGQWELTMVHIAMFDAVNSIEPRYRPYLVRLATPKGTSLEVAAATAAGTVLAGLPTRRATAEMKAALPAYFAAIPDGEAKVHGIKLGEAVAANVPEARQNDSAVCA
jgi:hypothetical protein